MWDHHLFRLIVLFGCYMSLLAGSTDISAYQGEQRGETGVATQRKTMQIGRYLKPRIITATADTAALVHRPLKKSADQNVVPRMKATDSKQNFAPIPHAGEPPVLITNFSALGDDGSSIPPDTHGAVGPNHLMVTLNTEVRIQDRFGGNMSTVSLNDFWSGFFNSRTFDPKILYDHQAGRWMFTAMADPAASSSSVVIAVSQTSDPTGTWHMYRIDADASNISWADYPSMGYNKDWIIVQANLFSLSGNAFNGSQIYVFDKADLYAGGAGAFTRFTDVSGFTQTPAITYDDTLSTIYLVEQWVPDENYDLVNRLRISKVTGPVGSEVYTPGIAIVTTPDFWDDEAAQTNFAPQAGTSLKIMTNDARLQNTVYRNGSLWTVQTVFLPAGNSENRSSIQWWELSPEGSIRQRGLLDDPTGVKFFAYPSISVNRNNAVLIGYSSFSSDQFASAGFAFRNADDPVNTLQEDTLLKAGEGSYSKTFGTGRNRWGDYSNTVIDPVNDTGFWTIQQYAVASPGSDKWGTWWGHIVPPAATPDIAVAETAIDIGGVDIHQNVLRQLTLRNNGAGLLTVSNISTSTEPYSLSPNEGTLVSGDSLIVELSFVSSQTGVFPDTVNISSDDEDSPSLQIPVVATVIRRGDLNGDGDESILDIIMLVRTIIGRSPAPEPNSPAFYTSDVNNDGQMSILDVVNLINRILGVQSKAIASYADNPVEITITTSEPLEGHASNVTVIMQNEMPVAAFHLSITDKFASLIQSNPLPTDALSYMTYDVYRHQNGLDLIIYSLDGNDIPPGTRKLINFQVTDAGVVQKDYTDMFTISVADRGARRVPVKFGAGIRNHQIVAPSFSLTQNNPNPFNPATEMAYTVPTNAYVSITIYNLLGQEIVKLIDAPHIPGTYYTVWDGKNSKGQQAASGVYLYRMVTDTGFSASRRMILLR